MASVIAWGYEACMSKAARQIATAIESAPSEHGDSALEPVLRPSGRLDLRRSDDAAALAPEQAVRLQHAFTRGQGYGLVALGADEVGSALPPALAFWRQIAARFIAAVCALPDIAERTDKPAVTPPPVTELEVLADAAPPMPGAEYLSADVLAALWRDMDAAFDAELAGAALPVQEFLKRRNPAWNLVGRVHFNLAENRKDEEAPFAFLVTYTTRLSATAKAQHVPLGKALQDYAGADNRERLLSLLTPVQRAAETCAWLKTMVAAGEVYQPMRWSPTQAMQLLRDVPALESAGVIVRMPSTWRMNRPARPQVKTTVGAKTPSQLGLDAMLDFNLAVTLDGDTLTADEIEKLLAQTDGLAFIRGQWIEVDRERLSRTLAHVQGGRESCGERRAVIRGGDASGGRRRYWQRSLQRGGDGRLEPDRSGTMARRDARRASTSRYNRAYRSRRRVEGDAAPLSEHRRPMAASARQIAAWRLSRRRHGPRQDDPGDIHCFWC